MPQDHRSPVDRAIAQLEGGETPASPADLARLGDELKRARAFPYAQRIFALARERLGAGDDPALATRLRQQHALCTYKNPEVISEEGLREAICILDDPGDALTTTSDPETLGIAGAIHKRLWEIDGRERHLEQSLDFYRRAWQQGPEVDDGYTGINAAFVHDLLAETEEGDSGPGDAAGHREKAQRIRERIRDHLEQKLQDPAAKDYWSTATLAEAHLGLGDYARAGSWLAEAARCDPEEWMVETTARQLASILRIRGAEADARAKDALQKLIGGDPEALTTAFAGKLGLALSGGGFRASLFHIGVLAKLAELDLLRHVEVLSCVSGGSILGAHYYLVLRRELERRPDGKIDYVEIVREVARDFVAAVASDVRNSVIKSPTAVVKLLAKPGYTRSVRIAELYEERIYGPVLGREGPIPLRDLRVSPHGHGGAFHPRRDNWRRHGKVPVLVLNATTLNTGHTWQYTSTFMGEPTAHIDESIDRNERLRRMYYDEAPAPHSSASLGGAVAASACVPGIFRPLVLKGLYPGKTVRLVDGGVRDNQGVLTLLEQDCNAMIVSDASGQMDSQDDPKWAALGVSLRSNSILQSTIRSILYRELSARQRSSRLRELSFLHLKRDLDAGTVDWKQPGAASTPTAAPKSTPYGVPEPVQAALAAIRTDLDAFSETEAQALILSGYLQAGKYVPQEIRSLPARQAAGASWPFLALRSQLTSPDLLRELRLGSRRFFRGPRRLLGKVRDWLS